MTLASAWQRIRQLVRYYQAAAVNTVFGISAYMLLVWLGLDMFVAQAVSHVMGVGFNYFTYSRHVFSGSSPAKLRFALSYGVNYLVNLAVLAGIAQFVENPYIAGLIAAVVASLINFVVLRSFVFRAKTA